MPLSSPKNFDFFLPKELIAQYPAPKREASRLMVFHRETQSVEHQNFYQLIDCLQAGDLLVLNNTKVIPAELTAQLETGRSVELLLLRDLGEGRWRCLAKPSKYLKEGTLLLFNKELSAKVTGLGEKGVREIQFEADSHTILNYAHTQGKMPLPPYIKREVESSDIERYQTVYAKKIGAAAAPTAGLHFTPELLNQLEQKGVERAFVTLHVGLGTFRPLTEKEWHSGKLHPEEFEIDSANVAKINAALKEKRRVIAVGTTSVRAVETAAQRHFPLQPICSETDLFIFPPFEFKVIQGLITNFHLPNSSLLWLVSAFIGEEKLRSLYEEAIAQKYRFYSYGDAMLIV